MIVGIWSFQIQMRTCVVVRIYTCMFHIGSYIVACALHTHLDRFIKYMVGTTGPYCCKGYRTCAVWWFSLQGRAQAHPFPQGNLVAVTHRRPFEPHTYVHSRIFSEFIKRSGYKGVQVVTKTVPYTAQGHTCRLQQFPYKFKMVCFI
jgi:hypothetical protein